MRAPPLPRLRLAHRLSVVLGGCVLLTALAVGYVFQVGRSAAMLEQSGARLTEQGHRIGDRLRRTFAEMERELRFLALAPSVQGIVRARDGGGVDPLDGSTEAAWLHRIEQAMIALLRSHPEYLQAQLIDVADGARELARAGVRDGAPSVASGRDLRSGVRTAAFAGARTAPPGAIILAVFDEPAASGGARPTATVAAPVYGAAAEPFAVLALRRDLAADLHAAAVGLPPGVGMFVARGDGGLVYAHHPGSAGQAATGLAGIAPMATDFLAGTDTQRLVPANGDERGAAWFFRRLQGAAPGAAGLVLALRAPYTLMAADAESALHQSLLLTVLLVALAMLVGAFFSRRLTAPLQQLTAAATALRRGERDIALPARDRGEFGVLAAAFSDMVTEVRRRETSLAELNAHLEERVRQRSTELAQSTARLQEQAEVLDLVLEHTLEGVLAVDRDGHFLLFNRAARHILGDEPAGGLAELRARCVPLRPELGTAFAVAELPLERALAGHASDDVELAVRSPDERTLRHLRISGRALRDATGALRGAVATFRDVSAQRDVESLQRLAHLVFEHSAQAILVTDAERRILEVNPAFTRLTGFHPEEVIGRDPNVLNSGQQNRDFYDRIWDRIERDGLWEGEIWNRRRDGELYAEHASIIAVRGPTGEVVNYVGMFSDVTERKRAEEQVYRLAHFDGLTGLPNRLLFRDRLQHAVDRAKRHAGQLAMLFIDLDRFKPVNDTFGHAAGDQVLLEVAQRLAAAARESDTVARFGGDEFAVALEETDREQAEQAAQRLLAVLRQPIAVLGQQLQLGASIGISMYPDDGKDAATLLQFSDLAMYRVKEQGRNGVSFFRPELSERPGRRLRLEQRLRLALANGRLELHYQPRVAIGRRRVVGAEALVRWHDPEQGWVRPEEFIQVAEDSGLIQPLGAWVWEQACRQRAAWRGLVDDGFRMSVNLAPRQLELAQLADNLLAALERHGVAPGWMELEVTESALMRDPAQARALLERLSAEGIGIALDDFGTGYSSLAYLKRFPIDRLKLDRTFVQGLPADPDDAVIARTVVAMARAMRLPVTAEGVERPEQLAFLAEHGCDEFQGYLCQEPRPAADTAALLQRGDWRWPPVVQDARSSA